MLGNDISNRVAPIICFDLDSLLFSDKKIEEDGLLDKLIRKLGFSNEKADYFNREINHEFSYLVNGIWYKYDFCIYFVTKYPYEAEISEFLFEMGINHTRVLQYPNVNFLRMKSEYEWFIFVSNDLELVSVISNKHTITLRELPKLLSTTRF